MEMEEGRGQQHTEPMSPDELEEVRAASGGEPPVVRDTAPTQDLGGVPFVVREVRAPLPTVSVPGLQPTFPLIEVTVAPQRQRAKEVSRKPRSKPQKPVVQKVSVRDAAERDAYWQNHFGSLGKGRDSLVFIVPALGVTFIAGSLALLNVAKEKGWTSSSTYSSAEAVPSAQVAVSTQVSLSDHASAASTTIDVEFMPDEVFFGPQDDGMLDYLLEERELWGPESRRGKRGSGDGLERVDKEAPAFYVEQQCSEDEYKRLKKIAALVNVRTRVGRHRLYHALDTMGVLQKLRKSGAQTGDRIFIGGKVIPMPSDPVEYE